MPLSSRIEASLAIIVRNSHGVYIGTMVVLSSSMGRCVNDLRFYSTRPAGRSRYRKEICHEEM